MSVENVQEGPFLTRLSSLPLVTSAIDQATDMYERTKESNRLLKYTLQTAEVGVKKVASTAQPVVTKLEAPINKLNNLACGQLDKLQQNYPIITQSTEQIYEQTKNLYDIKFKPAVDKVAVVTNKVGHIKTYTTEKIDGVKRYTNGAIQGAKTYTYGKVEGVTTSTTSTIQGVKGYTTSAVHGVTNYTTDRVHGAKAYGLGKLSVVREYSTSQMTVALDSVYGKMLTETLDKLLQATEDFVDYYLPAEEESEKDTPIKNGPKTTTRLRTLGSKAKRGVFARALTQFQQLQQQSKEAMVNLTHTVDLIEYAKNAQGHVKDTLTSTGDRFQYYWKEINRPEDDDTQTTKMTGEEEMEGQEDNHHKSMKFSEALEQRLLASARRLTLQLKRGVHVVSTHLPVLPPQIKDRVTSAKNFVDELYCKLTTATSLNDLPKLLLDQTRERLGHVQETISFVADYIVSSWALRWLVKQEDKALENSKTPEDKALEKSESSEDKDMETSESSEPGDNEGNTYL